jgi:hypothetical protein
MRRESIIREKNRKAAFKKREKEYEITKDESSGVFCGNCSNGIAFRRAGVGRSYQAFVG